MSVVRAWEKKGYTTALEFQPLCNGADPRERQTTGKCALSCISQTRHFGHFRIAGLPSDSLFLSLSLSLSTIAPSLILFQLFSIESRLEVVTVLYIWMSILSKSDFLFLHH